MAAAFERQCLPCVGQDRLYSAPFRHQAHGAATQQQPGAAGADGTGSDRAGLLLPGTRHPQQRQPGKPVYAASLCSAGQRQGQDRGYSLRRDAGTVPGADGSAQYRGADAGSRQGAVCQGTGTADTGTHPGTGTGTRSGAGTRTRAGAGAGNRPGAGGHFRRRAAGGPRKNPDGVAGKGVGNR